MCLVAVLITETVWSPELATYINVPSGLMATPLGLEPTRMVACTIPVVVSITETVPSPTFATYANLPSGLMATPAGVRPTGKLGTNTILVAASINETVFEPVLATYIFPVPAHLNVGGGGGHPQDVSQVSSSNVSHSLVL